MFPGRPLEGCDNGALLNRLLPPVLFVPGKSVDIAPRRFRVAEDIQRKLEVGRRTRLDAVL